MASDAADFATLLSRARQGDEAAMAELAREYEAEVRIVARVLLGPKLRPYLDSLDLVQSVHRSLMVGLRAGKVDVSSPERLVALTLTMVRRKIARQWRRHQRQQRLDVREADSDALTGRLMELTRPEDDPAKQAQLRDTLRRVCDGLDDLDRQVLGLRLAGHSTAEAARQLSQNADVLRVRMSRLRQRLRTAGVHEEFV
jgi:RNA polymerase sigma-70 factor (ECF subfamily)